jgi:L-ribulose-5-phosphate 4-epimerase
MDRVRREEILEANLMLQRMGLVIFTWGNVSGIDRQKGEVTIKPSGVPYDKMKAEDLVTVDMQGKVLEGSCKPSSDLATHLEIYRSFPACGGVVHTHSRMATAWAQAGCDLPSLGTTHADYFYGPIPCTRSLTDDEIKGAYELETGRVIIETFKERRIDPQAVPGVLVSGHGPFTWGSDPMNAVHNTAVLEEVAQMAFASLAINPELAGISQQLLDKHYLRKHGKDAYYGQK